MTARPRTDWVSPSLVAVPDGEIAAYELKFLLPDPVAREVEAWAAARMALDPHADPALGNRYRVTSLYFDTPRLDVYRRADGFRRHKYRVRRYGTDRTVHLERKSKQGGRVWKHRTQIPLDRFDLLTAGVTDVWPAPWFAAEVADRGLRPVCRVTYQRAAFVGSGPTGPIRLTTDRAAVGAAADGLHVDPLTDGLPLLRDEVIVEFKFLAAMPAAFKDVIERLRLRPSPVSKYRRCAAAAGLAQEGTGDA